MSDEAKDVEDRRHARKLLRWALFVCLIISVVTIGVSLIHQQVTSPEQVIGASKWNRTPLAVGVGAAIAGFCLFGLWMMTTTPDD